MDKLSFLILSSLKEETYFNWASLVEIYTKDPNFFGHEISEVEDQYKKLIREGILIPHPISGGDDGNKNYMLSEKGDFAYLRQLLKYKLRREKQAFQEKLMKSQLDSNLSVQTTNSSVQQTNTSVQELNQITKENIPRQNKLTKTNIWVAVGVGLIALASLIQQVRNTPEAGIIKELQENNKLLRYRDSVLTQLLIRQTRMDSADIKKRSVPDTTTLKK
jgi:hypothetical protein